MEESKDKKVWFVYRKQYIARTGYWKPVCWQGWMVHFGLPIVFALVAWYINIDFNLLKTENLIKIIMLLIIFVPIWIFIYYTKGEKVKWWKLRGGKTLEEWNKEK